MQAINNRTNIFLLALPTLAVVVIAATVFVFFQRIKEADHMRDRIQLSMRHAESLLISLATFDTAVRDYLPVDSTSAIPSDALRSNITTSLKLLKSTSVDPLSVKQLNVVAPLVEQKVERLNYALELKKSSQLEILNSRLRTGEDMRLTDLIRMEVEKYTQLQSAQLDFYADTFRSNMKYLLFFIIFTMLFMLLFSQGFTYAIYRTLRQRVIRWKTSVSLALEEAVSQQLNLSALPLNSHENKFDLALKSSSEAVIATDREARITLMNNVAEQLTGYSHAFAAGRPIAEIVQIASNDNGKPFGLAVSDLLEKGVPKVSKDTILIGRDGKQRKIADSCSAIRDDNDQVIGAVIVFRDLTDQSSHRPQQLVMDSSGLLQTVFASVADGIIAFDVDTNIIRTVNAAAEKMFGYGHSELIGKRFDHLVSEFDASNKFLSYESNGGNGELYEVQGKLQNGQLFALEMTVSEMRLGTERYCTAVLRNVSARENSVGLAGGYPDRYRNLFNTIDEGFCTLEVIYEDDKPVDYLFIEVNPSFEKQTGLTEVTGKRISQLIPNFEQNSLRVYDRVATTGESARFVQYQPALDRWFDVYACPENSKNNKNVIVLFTDITKRKHAEDALRESDERVRLATEATGVGIWEWDLVQQKMHWDAQMFRIYGVTPTEDGYVDYDDWAIYLLPEDLRNRHAAPSEIRNPGEQRTREFRVKREGEKKFRYIRSVEIMHANAAGEVESIIGTNLDITETKKTEKRLRENERHLRAVIDALPVAIYTTDEEGVLTHFNQAAVEFSGRTPQLGVDRWCISQKLLRPDGTFLAHDSCPMATALNERRQILGAEAIAERPDGTQAWFNAYPTPLFNADGKLIGGINMLIDITERKRLDQVILENNIEMKKAKYLADKANLAKSNFLSNMSHELRTPLGAILGFAQLIEASDPPPTPSQKRSVEQILQAGWYLLDLINEILDLTLVESGKLSLSMEPVSLGDLLSECETMIEPQALTRGITLAFPTLEQPFNVNADQTRLKQVLINLLSNAVKYNRANGKVIVTCFQCAPQQLRVCVEDTGVGLSPENVAQLFQPFNRLGKENGPEEGTGIGLVVTKRLVELMGGKIDVESREGKGTVFWIDLDMAAENQVPSKHNSNYTDMLLPPSSDDLVKRKILYVEDNPANLMLVEDIMASRPNMALLSARDGYQGIEIARLAQPDLILMDINLPGISGTEAMQMLAKDPITSHIPVIALSANANPRDIEKGLRAGFFRYLTKPIKINEFMSTVDLALEASATKLILESEEKII
ncbi:MAG TPA: PAS domain S-box protein [Cellvibrionaceae bacterium]